MIDPYTCPICKLTVENFKVNESKTHRFIECSEHNSFIVSVEAERLLLKELGCRIKAAESFDRVEVNKILEIEEESNNLKYSSIPIPEWCK